MVADVSSRLYPTVPHTDLNTGNPSSEGCHTVLTTQSQEFEPYCGQLSPSMVLWMPVSRPVLVIPVFAYALGAGLGSRRPFLVHPAISYHRSRPHLPSIQFSPSADCKTDVESEHAQPSSCAWVWIPTATAWIPARKLSSQAWLDRPPRFNVSRARCATSISVVILPVSRPAFADLFAHSASISGCRSPPVCQK